MPPSEALPAAPSTAPAPRPSTTALIAAATSVRVDHEVGWAELSSAVSFMTMTMRG